MMRFDGTVVVVVAFGQDKNVVLRTIDPGCRLLPPTVECTSRLSSRSVHFYPFFSAPGMAQETACAGVKKKERNLRLAELKMPAASSPVCARPPPSSSIPVFSFPLPPPPSLNLWQLRRNARKNYLYYVWYLPKASCICWQQSLRT